MRKMIVVAVREYQAAVKTKTFLITVLAMPVLMGGSIVAQVLLRDQVDTTDKRIAIVDYTGQLHDSIDEAAQQRNVSDDVFKTEGDKRKQIRPRFLIEPVEAASDNPAEVALQLSDRVRRKENPLFAFLIIGPDAVQPGDDPERCRVQYHSNAPVYDDLRQWVSRALNDKIRQLRLEKAELDPEIVRQATRYMPVAKLGLVSMDETGQISEAEETNELATIGVPMGMMMLMFMVIMVGASPLTQSVLEEKMQRIAEVLLGSIGPFQLMMGKLIGTVGVSLTLATLYMGGAFYALYQTGYGHLFPAHLVWWFVTFQCLAVLLYGSLFIAIGAAVSDLKESQNMLMPVMIIVVAPMFVWLNVIREPSATFSIVASLIPTATPMLMLMRQAVPPGVPLWQPALGIVLVLATTGACVFVAGRIFRVGLLMQGKGASIGEMMRWVVRG